jgi:hypothetical protein
VSGVVVAGRVARDDHGDGVCILLHGVFDTALLVLAGGGLANSMSGGGGVG